jgi:NodT family efflux transporter outer membrane factor (OMF) lipoprotein
MAGKSFSEIAEGALHPFPIFNRLQACAALLFAAVSVLVLGSCAVHSDKWKSSIAVPSKWNAKSPNGRPLDTAALEKWWRRFNDPALDQLISQALAASPDIKTAISRVAQARGERSVQIAGLLPTIKGNTSDQIQRRDEQSTGLVSRSETYNLSLDMSWQVDLFGRQMQNVAAATKDVQQAVENYYAAQVTLCGDVAAAYISLRGTQAQLEVLHRNIATQEETANITRWKKDAGLSDTLALDQAVSTLEQARAAIPSLEQTISETRNQLAVLCGQTPGTLDRLLERSSSMPRIPASLATGVPVEALDNRPDVRSAIDAVLAASHRKTEAELERLPTLNLGGAFGLEALRTGTIFSPEAAARTLAGSLLASLAQPIFEGGQITANIHINQELVKQAVYAYQSRVLTALSEVEDAFTAIRKTTDRLEVLIEADRAASAATMLATQQYQAGQVDLLTVLDTQRTQLSVEQQRASTEAEQLTAYVQLYKSLGGGWQPL